MVLGVTTHRLRTVVVLEEYAGPIQEYSLCEAEYASMPGPF